MAGKRAGMEGARSGLFFEAVRIISELRPRFAVWENVAGALSSKGGADFGAALDALAEIGAVAISYRILNAQFFGVAQRRRRVFLVADFGGVGASEILLEPEGVRGHPAPSRAARSHVAALTARGVGTCGADDNQAQAGHLLPVGMIDTERCLSSRNERYDYETETFVIDTPDTASAITASAGHHGHSSPRGDGSDNKIVTAAAFDPRNVTSAANRTRVEFGLPANTLHADGLSVITQSARAVSLRGRDGGATAELGGEVASALRSSQGGGDKAHVLAFQERGRDGGRSLEFQDDVAYALLAPVGGGRAQERNICTPTLAVRRLTPLECERLQGWADDWTRWDDQGREIADSHRYRCIGNGVVAPVANWIAQRMAAVLTAAQESAA